MSFPYTRLAGARISHAAAGVADVWDPASLIGAGGISIINSGESVLASSHFGEVGRGCLGTKEVLSGKAYIEFIIDAIGGLADGANNPAVGFAQSPNSGGGSGTPGSGITYYDNQGTPRPGSILHYSTFAPGDVVGCAYDIATGNAWFAVNNVWQGGGDPVVGSTPTAVVVGSVLNVHALIWIQQTSGANTAGATLQTTAVQMTYTPPVGFTRWGEI